MRCWCELKKGFESRAGILTRGIVGDKRRGLAILIFVTIKKFCVRLLTLQFKMTSLSSIPPQSQRVGPDVQDFDPDSVDFEPLLVTGSK